MTVQLTVHFHRLPEPGTWVASRFTTRHLADGFHEEDGELWDEQGRLVAQSPSARDPALRAHSPVSVVPS